MQYRSLTIDNSAELKKDITFPTGVYSAGDQVGFFEIAPNSKYKGGIVLGANLYFHSLAARKDVDLTILLYNQLVEPGPGYIGDTNVSSLLHGGIFSLNNIPFGVLKFSSSDANTTEYSNVFTDPGGGGTEVSQILTAINPTPDTFDLKDDGFGEYAIHGIIITNADLTTVADDNFGLNLKVSW